MNIFLSIIIPVYKVEPYIRQCLQSIIPQIKDRSDVEVIIVDDGSPDKSIEIAEETTIGISNITIHHQSNQGLSMARNNGLECSKGTYVWFIDSDDYLVPDVLSGIMDDLKQHHPDILQVDYQFVYEDSEDVKPSIPTVQFVGIRTGKEVLKHGGLPPAAPFSIFKRSLLIENNLRFGPGRLHEDLEFKPRATYFANSVKWHSGIVYNYLQRANSITTSFKLKNAKDLLWGMDSIRNFTTHHIMDKTLMKGYARIIGSSNMNLLTGLASMDRVGIRTVVKEMKHHKETYRFIMKNGPLKHSVMAIMASYFPGIAIWLKYHIKK